MHARASERRDRPVAQRRVIGGQQVAQQLHGLGAGKFAQRIHRAAPHQDVLVVLKRLDDELEALRAPEPAERSDAVPADLLPRLLAQAPLECGQRLMIGEESERRVRGRPDPMARFGAAEEFQQRRRPSRFTPVAEGFRGLCSHVRRFAPQCGDERLEGNGPMLPPVPFGSAGRAEQSDDEDEPACEPATQ